MRLSLKGAAAALALTLCAGTAAAQETVHLRMTQAFGETSAFYQLFALPLVERVKELTDGQVVIEPFPAGVIAPAFEAYDAVADGTADAVQSSAVYLVSRDPTNGLFTGLPGGMSPEVLMQWMWHGGGKELLAQHREETMNMHSMPCGLGATELLGHSHKPIRTLEDFQGVKFRTAGAFADILTELGASPTVVPGSEVYTMLERGAIDATEWGSPSENMKAGLQETAKYIIYPGPQTNAFFMEFAVDLDKWNAIDPKLQKKIEAACMLSSLDTLMAFDELDRKAWKEMKAGKNEIIALDPAVLDKIRELGRAWVKAKVDEAEAAGNNPWMKRVSDSYFSFYDDWLENAEFRAIDRKN